LGTDAEQNQKGRNIDCRCQGLPHVSHRVRVLCNPVREPCIAGIPPTSMSYGSAAAKVCAIGTKYRIVTG
jgi:hypothetical protein